MIGGIQRLVQSLFASAIQAIRENHQCLAAIFWLHQFIRREKDGVIQLCPVARVSPLPLPVVSCRLRTLRVIVRAPGRTHLLNLVIELLPRGREVLQQFNLAIKVQQKRRVSSSRCAFGRLRRAIVARFPIGQHLVHKLGRRFALVFHRCAHAPARVDQQAQLKGQVRLLRETLDHLRPAVFGQRKVRLLQRCHQGAVLVPHHDGQQHLARLHVHGCHRLVARGLLACWLLASGHRGHGNNCKGDQKSGIELEIHSQATHFQSIRRSKTSTVDRQCNCRRIRASCSEEAQGRQTAYPASRRN